MLGEVVVEVRVEVRIRLDLVDVLQPQPLRGEPRPERLGARIGEHAPGLPLEHDRRRTACPAPAIVDQFLVRRRAPEEERQARRQIEIGDAIGGAGLRGFGLALEPEDEMRARQNRLERGAARRPRIRRSAAPFW